MGRKPTNREFEQRIGELEREVAKLKKTEAALVTANEKLKQEIGELYLKTENMTLDEGYMKPFAVELPSGAVL
jgi:regulator of replication initiation timing